MCSVLLVIVCPLSFDHCINCLFYTFVLPVRYLQSFLDTKFFPNHSGWKSLFIFGIVDDSL